MRGLERGKKIDSSRRIYVANFLINRNVGNVCAWYFEFNKHLSAITLALRGTGVTVHTL